MTDNEKLDLGWRLGYAVLGEMLYEHMGVLCCRACDGYSPVMPHSRVFLWSTFQAIKHGPTCTTPLRIAVEMAERGLAP